MLSWKLSSSSGTSHVSKRSHPSGVGLELHPFLCQKGFIIPSSPSKEHPYHWYTDCLRFSTCHCIDTGVVWEWQCCSGHRAVPCQACQWWERTETKQWQKKKKKLVDPNHNGYEVASGSGSELQKSLLAFPANRAFFGSYSHSCAIPGRYVHKQMHIHDRGERGGEETDCCYESLGQQGALKCKQSQCGSWCPVHRGRSLKTLQWSQGEKPARHSNQGPARSWSALLPPSGWAQSWVGWNGSPPPSIWRSFPPVFQQMTKVWAISPGFQPAVLTALYFQPFPVQLKVVKA